MEYTFNQISPRSSMDRTQDCGSCDAGSIPAGGTLSSPPRADPPPAEIPSGGNIITQNSKLITNNLGRFFKKQEFAEFLFFLFYRY